MTDLALIGGSKLTNKDMHMFLQSKCKSTLHSLDLSGCTLVNDFGIGHVCTAFGDRLRVLNFSGSSATDKSTEIVALWCSNLRSLDLSRCAHITDATVHTAAKCITALTTLKLDGNPAITSKTLMSYVGSRLEFAEMASHWIGYRPKVGQGRSELS